MVPAIVAAGQAVAGVVGAACCAEGAFIAGAGAAAFAARQAAVANAGVAIAPWVVGGLAIWQLGKLGCKLLERDEKK